MARQYDVEFNLFKKGNIYYADFYIDGKRYKRTTGKRRQSDARVAAEEIVAATLEELFVEAEISLAGLIARYMKVIRVENKTWKDKVVRLRRFVEFVGDVKLSRISPLVCQEFITHVSSGGVSNATVNRYLATIKHLFNKAIDWEMLERNPVRRIKLYRETPRMRYYSAAELKRLTYQARQLSWKRASENQYVFYYILMTAIYTGMRLGEIINLKWDDIQGGSFVIQKSKNGKKRHVPVKDELSKVLRELPNDGEYIFPLRRRKSDAVTKIWSKVSRLAGIKDGRFHDIRHTFGSNLIRSGVDVVTVKELLGHSDLRMTQIYTHSSLEQKEKAIGDLEVM